MMKDAPGAASWRIHSNLKSEHYLEAGASGMIVGEKGREG